MIADLFSHKIHSSGEEWPEKLAELAAIFGEFDGQVFSRAALEERLRSISPRAAYVANEVQTTARGRPERLDISKFRDEISAYPAYLGLYFLEKSPRGWVLRLSETAKRFLLREEPDVASFLRLQLPLFQYPNAMGAAYMTGTNSLRIQANARDRALQYISNGIHLSPVRLIAVALKADAELRGAAVVGASVSFDEIFGLANVHRINSRALPRTGDVVAALRRVRQGRIPVPKRPERRFHTLTHTEIFGLESGKVRLRPGVNDTDRDQLLRQLEAICSIENEFDGFDHCTTGRDIEEVIAGGEWGRYFDAVRVLPSDIVEKLTKDHVLNAATPLDVAAVGGTPSLPQPVAQIDPLRDRSISPPPIRPYDRRGEMADPELTRIKLQRRNLAHKELVEKMDAWLRRLGAQPKESDHIDLFARIPGDGSFIFEMKSGGEGILEQIRKGLSQLYEYRYRYRNEIRGRDISLCLVLPERPTSMPWVTDYLCSDRGIGICWFEESGQPAWPELCADKMEALKPF